MIVWLFTLGLLAQWGPVSDAGALQGVANLSSKPSICGARAPLDGFWSKARDPRVARYCMLLAKGYSLLGARQPNAAIAQAERAGDLITGQADPVILMARAQAELGQFGVAWQQFSKAEKLPGFRIDAVEALHDYARSALVNGELDVARRSYRRLVTRSDLFADRRRALQVYIEAALVVMQEGRGSLPLVLAYLEEARRRNDSTLYPYTLGALSVLARERNGEPERARKMRSELDAAGLEKELTRSNHGDVPLVPPIDHEALIAVSLRALDPNGAREKWAQVLAANPSSPWASEIQSRLGVGKKR